MVTVYIVSQFIGGTSLSTVAPMAAATHAPILEALKAWAIGTVFLLLKILGIIIFIMILQEYLVSLRWLDYIHRIFRPFILTLGLSHRTILVWLTAMIFGLFYGGALIMEEAKKRTLSKEELEHFQVSIGINHSMIEDPSLFAVLGLNPFWLWVPRFIMAIVVVQLYRLAKLVMRKSAH